MIQELKNAGHLIEAHLWRLLYGFPDTAMHVYGVTGTNGKTTTSYLLASMLEHAYGAHAVGMLTTVSFRIAGKEEFNTTKMTTLPSRKIFAYLARMKRAGVTHAVLEVTSHALDQHRIAGIRLDGAIILNVAREHLDYHKAMEQYASAKEKIVSYLKPGALLVGKQDDRYVRGMLDRAEKKGRRVVRVTARDIERTDTPLSGSINKENAASAALLARAIGISDKMIYAGIAAVKSVPGRMEVIQAAQGFTVIIDYAVTPDALERLYADVRRQAGNKRVLAILGAAGLRDRGKRPDMARAVAKYADRIVVTREDPWTESEEQIFSDLERGLTGISREKWERIIDRKEAIATLLKGAQSGDFVVVTGKGAERGMAVGKEIIPWNDREVITQLLADSL